MPDLDQQLVAFGRWLDAELDARAGGAVPLYVQPPGRRRHRAWLVGAAAAATLAAGITLALVSRSDLPDVGPNVPTPAPTTVVATTTTTSTVTTRVGTAPEPSPPYVSSAAAPSVVSSAATSTVTPSSPPSVSVGSSSAGPGRTAPATSAAPTQPTNGAAPIPDTPTVVSSPTTPLATPPPSATSAPGSCYGDARRIGRAGTMKFQVCPDGLYLTSVVPLAGWTTTAQTNGPPVIAVELSSGTQTISCTLSLVAGAIVSSGSC